MAHTTVVDGMTVTPTCLQTAHKQNPISVRLGCIRRKIYLVDKINKHHGRHRQSCTRNRDTIYETILLQQVIGLFEINCYHNFAY
ncbi:hypothetical protein M115_1365 [Bacteroides fragilis str. 3719 T6]|uniref:Uncharacterized protein n=1 Tax=Bacteroides fragilis str. 3976T8 TaxID=1339314 RepID=A0A016ARY0_BACFG|nr:hypothetical protein M085_1262 [Bacteroides fragilis str. 3986 N(B)19]EXZ74180.1 hypothetical protein M123_1580 [Bacteroides fragilis str. 3976T8]EXZ89953.1 hypothetical protein M068_1411 [Bacteroides fragilis str. J38-1]EYA01026.1 hypothetical protein M087_1362 [Bacteroides fragilis str. S23 R14]EYA49024.1 hypothetical protein M115_1365 [Bacteroides fragilis str. 3719 T6]